ISVQAAIDTFAAWGEVDASCVATGLLNLVFSVAVNRNLVGECWTSEQKCSDEDDSRSSHVASWWCVMRDMGAGRENLVGACREAIFIGRSCGGCQVGWLAGSGDNQMSLAHWPESGAGVQEELVELFFTEDAGEFAEGEEGDEGDEEDERAGDELFEVDL